MTFCSSAYAAKVVYGVSDDLGIALEKTVTAVESAANIYGSCVSRYPDLYECTEYHHYWECSAIRANHGDSCVDKPVELEQTIKNVKGLVGIEGRRAFRFHDQEIKF